ncbi:hypothetical protein ACC745_38300, partial [Rhizobium ruizarguesonis]
GNDMATKAQRAAYHRGDLDPGPHPQELVRRIRLRDRKPRSQMTARILIDWFEFGVRDEGELAVLVRDQLVFDTSLSEPPLGR